MQKEKGEKEREEKNEGVGVQGGIRELRFSDSIEGRIAYSCCKAMTAFEMFQFASRCINSGTLPMGIEIVEITEEEYQRREEQAFIKLKAEAERAIRELTALELRAKTMLEPSFIPWGRKIRRLVARIFGIQAEDLREI